jgi:hypothetical protein
MGITYTLAPGPYDDSGDCKCPYCKRPYDEFGVYKFVVYEFRKGRMKTFMHIEAKDSSTLLDTFTKQGIPADDARTLVYEAEQVFWKFPSKSQRHNIT